jgi:molecular chaperone DnaJ
MLARDHYATLGLPPTASEEEIEAAYKHLCRRYHPDINPGDPHAAAVFERIQVAYGVLSDPERRAIYDREGSPADRLAKPRRDLTVQLLPEAEDGGSWKDLFRLLREHRRRSAGRRGEDILATLHVPLSQVERGRRGTIEVRRLVTCDHCRGRGRVELQQKYPCERCQGSGEEAFVKGALSVKCICAECEGAGIVSGVPCEECDGRSQVTRVERVLVRVPPGVQDGQEIRVRGQGHAGRRGGDPGDLIVRCVIDMPAGVRRSGPHLHTRLPIAVWEAILGAKLVVPTLDGDTAILRIPPGTQSGTQLKIRGHGLELPDGRRGDMLVRVEVHIPSSVDEETKELARRFAARHSKGPREPRQR